MKGHAVAVGMPYVHDSLIQSFRYWWGDAGSSQPQSVCWTFIKITACFGCQLIKKCKWYAAVLKILIFCMKEINVVINFVAIVLLHNLLVA